MVSYQATLLGHSPFRSPCVSNPSPSCLLFVISCHSRPCPLRSVAHRTRSNTCNKGSSNTLIRENNINKYIKISRIRLIFRLWFHQSQKLLRRKNVIQNPRKTHAGLRQQFLNDHLLLDVPGIFRRVELEVVPSRSSPFSFRLIQFRRPHYFAVELMDGSAPCVWAEDIRVACPRRAMPRARFGLPGRRSEDFLRWCPFRVHRGLGIARTGACHPRV
jgi:hypothetical protein